MLYRVSKRLRNTGKGPTGAVGKEKCYTPSGPMPKTTSVTRTKCWCVMGKRWYMPTGADRSRSRRWLWAYPTLSDPLPHTFNDSQVFIDFVQHSPNRAGVYRIRKQTTPPAMDTGHTCEWEVAVLEQKDVCVMHTGWVSPRRWKDWPGTQWRGLRGSLTELVVCEQRSWRSRTHTHRPWEAGFRLKEQRP